jgi:hypothetical protein
MARQKKFWGRKDSMWGGETLTCIEVKPQDSVKLGVELKDKFRLEQGPGKSVTLIPDPDNRGTWKESHDKLKPVKVNPEKHRPTTFRRAHSMMVKIKKNAAAKQLFLIERENGTFAISSSAVHKEGELDHASAGVER